MGTIQELADGLKHVDAIVRINAVFELGKCGLQAVEAVPALIGALQDISPVVRFHAAFILAKLGPAAVAAKSALIEALNDDADDDVRGCVGFALSQIGSGAVNAVAEFRHDAVRALSRIGPLATKAVPALIKSLDDLKDPRPGS